MKRKCKKKDDEKDKDKVVKRFLNVIVNVSIVNGIEMEILKKCRRKEKEKVIKVKWEEMVDVEEDDDDDDEICVVFLCIKL